MSVLILPIPPLLQVLWPCTQVKHMAAEIDQKYK